MTVPERTSMLLVGGTVKTVPYREIYIVFTGYEVIGEIKNADFGF